MSAMTEKDSTAAALERVEKERRRQDALVQAGKFLWNCASEGPSYAERLAVLSEEVGEVAREVTEHLITTSKYAADPSLRVMPPHRETFYRKRLTEELVQVAAVCVAWIEFLSDAVISPEKPIQEEKDKAPRDRSWVKLTFDDPDLECTGMAGCNRSASLAYCDAAGHVYLTACSPSHHFGDHEHLQKVIAKIEMWDRTPFIPAIPTRLARPGRASTPTVPDSWPESIWAYERCVLDCVETGWTQIPPGGDTRYHRSCQYILESLARTNVLHERDQHEAIINGLLADLEARDKQIATLQSAQAQLSNFLQSLPGSP